MPEALLDPEIANEQRYEREVAAYLEAMREVAREEAHAATAHLLRRRAPVAADAAHDADAERCGSELERDAERALRDQSELLWVEGRSDAPSLAHDLLTVRVPSPPALERLCFGLSMVRQVLDRGFDYVERCMGDDLMFYSASSTYERAVAAMSPELAPFAEHARAQRGLVITGGTRKGRERAARTLHLRYLRLSRWVDPGRWPAFSFAGGGGYGGGRGPHGTTYVDDEVLYAMSPEAQAEIRRRLLITPPDLLLFGAPDLDTFMAETPKRVRCRLLTYLFMDGQVTLDLDRDDVHFGPPAPHLALPRVKPEPVDEYEE